ncbi:hypothetical protein ACIOWI_29560 [Streptomyces sp. NPDC087659]|uniref:hypothetical protein n=1 Tax=Streptomyces sp. NPDC087659 TaxID=3365801 RepID=UPI00380C7ABF
MTLPLAFALGVAAAAALAQLVFHLEDHKAYGLYAVALALAALHSFAYGNTAWGVVTFVLAGAFAGRWRRGVREDRDADRSAPA